MNETRNFSEEEANQLVAGISPNQALLDEVAKFNHINKIIQKYGDDINYLLQKRPCPIVPEKLKLKDPYPKGVLEKIEKYAKQGI